MIPSLIEKLIESCIVDNTINIKAIADTLGVDIVLSEDIADLCRIAVDPATNKPVISLHPSNDQKTKHSFVAIALAEYILTPNRVTQHGINYDMFFWSDIYHQRHSYRMLLATRLAVPEFIINQLGEPNFSTDKYIADSHYLPQFIRSCINNNSALFLLSNFSELT